MFINRPRLNRRSSPQIQALIARKEMESMVQQPQLQPPQQEKKQLLSNMFPAKVKGMKNDFCGKLSEL